MIKKLKEPTTGCNFKNTRHFFLETGRYRNKYTEKDERVVKESIKWKGNRKMWRTHPPFFDANHLL